jgi:ferritin-like metal-binding protein YciE
MSEPTLQQEIEARRPATEGTLQQLASVYIDSAAIMASVQAMMESVGQIMDSAKTVFEDIMVDEGVDLNG